MPKYWNGQENIVDPTTYIIDTTNEYLAAGPNGNPALAKKVIETFEEVGLVLMRYFW